MSANRSQGGDMALLRSVAEQLKTPLTIITRQAELSQLTDDTHPLDAKVIHVQAATALGLVESYLLGLQLLYGQTELLLEPVSVASTLVDVAHQLDGFAKQYGVDLELQIDGKYQPVMAHAAGLKSALLSLGYTLLESYPLASRRLTLAVHRTPHGIITGLYGDYQPVSSRQWRQALRLQGQARQPLRPLVSGSGAGIFVAQTILQAMTTDLRVGKHRKRYGLATTLQPSQQLQLV